MEDGALLLQALPQLEGVGQVAVMAQGHRPLAVVDQHRLGVVAVEGAGGGIAAMAHGQLAPVHLAQHIRAEDIVHQAYILVAGDDAVPVDGNAAALLTPVLKSIQRVIHVGG